MTRNQLQYWENQETIRSHKAMEAETRRANKAKERETERSNRSNEVNSRYATDVNAKTQLAGQQTNLSIAERNRQLGLLQLSETARSNQAREANTREQLRNDYRINMAKNMLQDYANVTARQQAQEAVRSHKSQESISLSNLSETIRSNLAKETETQRANMAKEGFTAESNAIDRARQMEQMRSNLANEEITRRGQNLGLTGSAISGGARLLSSKMVRKG